MGIVAKILLVVPVVNQQQESLDQRFPRSLHPVFCRETYFTSPALLHPGAAPREKLGNSRARWFVQALHEASGLPSDEDLLQTARAHGHNVRRQRIERRLRNLLFQSNRKRLIHLLLELVERYGLLVPDGVKINIKLTHLEMANVIGSTRETVTVVLGQLQDEGLIQVERRQITICQPEKLAAEVDEKIPTLRRNAETRMLAEAVR